MICSTSIEAAPKKKNRGPTMPWDDFRVELSRLKSYRTESAREGMEYRLDIIESVMKPRTLGELAKPARLTELQSRLLAGEPMRKIGGKMQLRPRSRHSVKSYMRHLIAALNWAHSMDWLPSRIKFRVLDVDKKTNKGRPLTTEEFERMLSACEKVCPSDSNSWKRLLRGLFESGLRLSESLVMQWDNPQSIYPDWPKRGRPVLVVPAAMHKSRKDETLPILPGFESLLLETPPDARSGFVFNPRPKRGSRRLTLGQASRIISEIGRKACVSVNGKGKPASAHDLRRSFAQRLAEAGVPSRDLQIIMRHSSMATTEAYYLTTRVQDVADRVAGYLDRTQQNIGTVNAMNTSEVSEENAATL